MKKRLTKGLRVYKDSLDEIRYTRLLLCRLADLPRWDMSSDLLKIDEKLKLVEQAEENLRVAKESVRKVAQGIWKKSVKKWTISELQEATGYYD